MTQEEKQLLLIDLCARLPYGVKVSLNKNNIGDLTAVYPFDGCVIIENLKNKIPITDFYSSDYGRFTIEEGEVKPYLRPMSGMTEKEIDKLFDILKIDKNGKDEDWIKINDVLGIKFFFPTGKWVENVAEVYDYLYSIHIDFRGLVPMGIALEAPEGMYKTE